jgi:RHS repeat-associated protein
LQLSGAEQHNFAYDQLDRLTQETNPRGTVTYSYDVLGRRTSLKINNQRNLNYAYDNNDRLTAITEGNETFGFSYDPLDRRAGMTLPNGISTAYNDAAGRLTGMKYSKGSQVVRDLTYGYDDINRRTSYSGNTAPAPRDTATINALNQYTTLNGKPVAHDENGNQTKNNAVWDARDRLVSLTGPNFTASFTYDAMGRRTSKTVNGQKKTYLYDGSDLISETGAEYTFGPGIDQPLERKSGQNEYYLADALGSVIGLADVTGAIKTSYNYSPFGKKQTTGAASSNPFAFTGREDDGTGYYYYRARYYSPDQKRFIAEDPLEFGGGDTNFYTYVGGNPVNFTDPSGNGPIYGSLAGVACAAGVVANSGLALASGGTLAPVNVLAAAAICSAVGSAIPDPTFTTDSDSGSFCALPKQYGPLRSDIWQAPQGKQAVIPGWVAKRLGLDKRQVGSAVENIKKREGLRGDDNVGLDLENGNILHPKDGEVLGNVHDENGDSKINKRGRGKKNK